MDADLALIGGGPVGSTLALLLARVGRRVAVLEKARLPRDKACGEGLLPSGVRVLADVGIDLAAEGFPPVAGVRYRLETGRSVRGDLRSGRAAIACISPSTSLRVMSPVALPWSDRYARHDRRTRAATGRTNRMGSQGPEDAKL